MNSISDTSKSGTDIDIVDHQLNVLNGDNKPTNTIDVTNSSMNEVHIETSPPINSTQNLKKSCFTPKRLIIIMSIALIIILGVTVGLVIALKKKPDSIPSYPDNYKHCENSEDCERIGEESFKINYAKSLLQIYNSESKTSSSVVLDENMVGKSTKRGLSENKIDNEEETSSRKFLFGIDSIDKNNKKYNAFAIILETQKNNKKEGDSIDYRKNKQLNNKSPAIKFSFDANGTISNILKPKEISRSDYNQLINFIESIIPNMKNGYEQNNKILTIRREDKAYSGKYTLDDSSSNTVSRLDLDDYKNAKNLNIKTDSNLFTNVDSQISDGSDDDSFNDVTTVRKMPIKELSSLSTSDLTLTNCGYNKKLEKKIYKCLESIDWIDEEESSKLEQKRFLNELGLTEKDLYYRRLEDIEEVSDLRNLDISQSFLIPFTRRMALFKVNVLGIKLGMFTVTSFYPGNSTALLEMVYKYKETEILIAKTEIKISAYKLAMDHIYVVYGLIESEFVDSIDNIKDKFKTWEDKMKEILNSLKTNVEGLENPPSTLAVPLDNLQKDILDFAKTNFEEFRKAIITSIQKFNELKNNIETEKDPNAVKIFNKSRIIVQTLFNDKKKHIEELFGNLTDVYNKLVNTIDKYKSDLTEKVESHYYYRTIDVFDEAILYVENFEKEINELINAENNQFKKKISILYKEKLKGLFSQTNDIYLEMDTNSIIIQSLNEDDISNIKTGLQGLEGTIEETLNTVTDKIKGIYDKIINKDQESFYKNDIKKDVTELKTKKAELSAKIQELINYFPKFTIYGTDLSKLYEIEEELINKKGEQYKLYITQTLEDKSSRIDTSLVEESCLGAFNQKKQELLKQIDEYERNSIFSCSCSSRQYPEELKKAIKEFIDEIKKLPKCFKENILEHIINSYLNTDFLDLMINNYYSELESISQRYNGTYLSLIKTNIINYVAPPEEIEQKLINIINTQRELAEEIGNAINEELLQYIKTSFSKKYCEAVNNLQKAYLEIFNVIPLYTYNNTTDEYKIIRDAFVFEADKYVDEYIKSKYNNSADPFKMIKKIKEAEQNRVIVYVETASIVIHDNYLAIKCEDPKNKDCVIINTNLTELQRKNYEFTKIRAIATLYKKLKGDSIDVITDNSLSGLKPDEYLEKYTKLIDLSFDKIQYRIFNYLDEISKGDYELVDKIKQSYKNVVDKEIDKLFSENTIKALLNQAAGKVYKRTKEEMRSLTKLYNSGGELYSSIYKAFENEINSYLNSDVNFDPEKYEKSYQDFISSLNNTIEKTSKEIFKSINYDKKVSNKIRSEIEFHIQTINLRAKEKLNGLHPKNLTLLNYNLDIRSFIEEKIDEKTNDMLNHLEKKADDIFNEVLKNEKKEWGKDIVNTYYPDIKATIQAYYNSLFTQMESLEFSKDGIKVESLSQNTIDSINNAMEIYLKSVSELFDNEYFYQKSLSDDSKREFPNIAPTEILNSINSNTTEHVDQFKQKLEREKKEFYEKLLNIVEEEYKMSIDTFVEYEGKKYVNKIYENEYLNSIYPRLLFYIKIQDQVHNYIKTISDKEMKLFTPQSLSYELEKLYTDVKEEVKNNILPKIANILSTKIDEFSLNTRGIISSKFSTEIINKLKSNDFKGKLNNDEVYNVIPGNFNKILIKKFTNYLEDQAYVSIFNNVKELYENKIKGDLKIFTDNADKYQKEINDFIATITIIQPGNGEELEVFISNANDLYGEILRHLICYKKIAFELPEEKVENAEIIINTEVVPYMESIVKSYTDTMAKTKNNLIDIAKSFKKTYHQEFNNDFKTKELIGSFEQFTKSKEELIELIKGDIKAVFEHLTSDDFKRKLENQLINIYKRNLQEDYVQNYSVFQIERDFKTLKKNYVEFSDSIYQLKEIINVETKHGIYLNELESYIPNINMKFKSILEYIEYFIGDENAVNELKSNVNNQIKEMNKTLVKYIEEENKKYEETFYDIVDTPYNILDDLKNVYRPLIDKALDKYLIDALDRIPNAEMPELEFIKLLNRTEWVYAEEIGTNNLLEFNISIIDYYHKGNFKITKNKDDRYFDVELGFDGGIDSKISYNINGGLHQELKGHLGDNTIKYITHNDLHTGLVTLTSKAIQNSTLQFNYLGKYGGKEVYEITQCSLAYEKSFERVY